MDIVSLTIVSAMLFDFLPKQGTALPQSTIVESETGAGELTVELDDGTIDGSSVALGAQRVPLANINLSASCASPVTVESIDFRHRGLGAVADISRVYIDNGMRRLTRGRIFDRQGAVTLRFLKPLTIPACDAVFLSVLVDIAPDASAASEHRIELAGSSPVRSSARRTILAEPAATSSAVRTAPVNGGFITVHFLPVTGTFRYGREEILARIQLIGDGKYAHVLKSITLTNIEGARGNDLKNLHLTTRAGEIVSQLTTQMDGQRLRLVFDPPFALAPSDTVVLLLKGTVHISRYRQVNFSLEEPSDLSAIVVPAR